MAAELPPPSHTRLSHRLESWAAWLLTPRPTWVYVLLAIALLVASELLWLWHSWPVREILGAELPPPGTTL